MIVLLMIAVQVTCAFWVYFDATNNKIGKVADAAGMFNMSAGGWAAVTMDLWIVGFPAYLINRPQLLERASQAPAQANRPLGFFSLAFAGALYYWFFTRIPGIAVPACDAPEVMGAAESAVSSAPMVKALGIQAVNVKDAGEAAYNVSEEKRTCRAVLTTDRGQVQLKYTVNWQNKSKGQFWIQIVQ